MIAALREGDQDTASLAFDGGEAAFIGGITRVAGKVINVTRRACPVVVQTAQLATNFIGGGSRAALSDPRMMGEVNQLRNRSLEDLLEELRSGGGQSGYSSRPGTSNLSQLSTQELLEELRRRTA
jgi:hypothetical protein